MDNNNFGNPSANLPMAMLSSLPEENVTIAAPIQEYQFDGNINLPASQQVQQQQQDDGFNENSTFEEMDIFSGIIPDFENLNDEFIGALPGIPDHNQNHFEQLSPSSVYTNLIPPAPNNSFSIAQNEQLGHNNTLVNTSMDSCNQWFSMQSPDGDLTDLTLLPSTSTLSNQLVLQSLGSPYNDATSQTFTDSSNSMLMQSPYSMESYIDSPCSYKLSHQQQSQQQHQPMINTGFLKVSIQPENTFRFRYEKEIETSHVYLRGTGSAGSNFQKCTSVELRLNGAFDDVGEYFLRCTLHKPLSIQKASTPNGHAPLSPHKLLRRRLSVDGFCDETEFYPLVKSEFDTNVYEFKMENFLIECAKISDYFNSCTHKFSQLFNAELENVKSRLRVEEPKSDSDSKDQVVTSCDQASSKNGKRRKTTEKKGLKVEDPKSDSDSKDQVVTSCDQASSKNGKPRKTEKYVQIGFEAFKFIDGSYISIADPVFTDTIFNGAPLNITRICNVKVSTDMVEEVTLLVSPLESNDITIHLKECDTIKNPWSHCIPVKNAIVHHNSAITFRAPRYQGVHQDAESIKISIHLERVSDRSVSNSAQIYYVKEIKRNIPFVPFIRTDEEPRPIATSKSKKKDANNSELQSDAVLFTHISEGSNDKKKAQVPIAELLTDQSDFESLEMTIVPSNQIQIGQQLLCSRISGITDNPNKSDYNLKKATTIDEFLNEIRKMYNQSKNKGNVAKKSERCQVRDLFLAYESRHPLANSILHDVLADLHLKKNEMFLHRVIAHFRLEDVVSKSTNIYGETALMYAFMFKSPLLLNALINMGTSVTAQDVYGNNVLHLAMQPQLEQQQQKELSDCLVLLKKKMKTDEYSSTFIKALGSFNLNGLTPLHLAVLENNTAIVADLLDFCQSVNSFDICLLGQLSDGSTILHLAVLNRYRDMRECILQHSPKDIFRNVVNFANQTAEEILFDMDKNDMEILTGVLKRVELQDSQTELNPKLSERKEESGQN